MHKTLTLILVCITMARQAKAQNCDSNYLSVIYSAKDVLSYKKAVTTPKNESFIIGNLFYPRGWLTKISNQGNTIWSHAYNADFEGNNEHTFNTPELIDVAASSSSSYVVSGSIIRDWDYILNGAKVPPPVTVGLITNIDQSGNVLWGREVISKYSVNRAGPWMYCTNVCTLANGNIIVYLAMEKFITANRPSYGKIVCFAPDGTLKWQSNLNTGDYEASGFTRYMQRAITQTKNGNIVVADGVCKRDFSYTDSAVYKSFAMHIFSINSNDGSFVWERSYEYPPSLYTSALTSFKNITELPDGRLSFITQLFTSASGQPPYYGSPVNIITDAKGRLIKTIAYRSPQNDIYILNDALTDDASGNRTLLFTNNSNNSAVLVHTNAEGQPLWSQGYGNASMQYPPVCFNKRRTGYNIFFSTFQSSMQAQVLITDLNGNINCANTEAQVAVEDVKWPYVPDSIHTIGNDDYDGFVVSPFALSVKDIPLANTTDCQKFVPCCVDVIDTLHIKPVTLCEGDTYTLPDNREVSVAVRYDVSYTTLTGCDSTAFYDINVFKKPSGLMTVSDTCLGENDSVTIHATKGFDAYKWMNIVTDKPFYEVYKEGAYYVNVSNACGTKTDTIHVYQQCEYPILLPSAFTPNGDGLNDVFRVPPLNKNHLMLLKIYNRFGQLMFSTSDKSKGWNGYINSFPADNGTYIYDIKMTGITGKLISQKGTIVLIR